MTSVPHSGAKSVTPGGSVAGGAGQTPGPWEANFSFPGRDGIGDVWQIDADGHAVCTTQFCYAPNTEANARLIAAAPDLLEALLKARAALVGDPDSFDIDYAFDVMNAAIAKAEGRS